MDKPEKCAHPSCQCQAKAGSKYCSTYCEGEAKTADIICNCGHPACTARSWTDKALPEHPLHRESDKLSETIPLRGCEKGAAMLFGIYIVDYDDDQLSVDHRRGYW
jgi:hypothetical protein